MQADFVKQKLKINDRWLIPPRVWAYSLLSLSVFSIIHLQGLENLFNTGIIDPRWHHIFAIPLISIFLLYVRKKPLITVPLWRSVGGLFFFLGGLCIYIVGVIYSSTLVMGTGMIVEIFGFTAFLCGWKAMRYLWIPTLYLFFAVKFTILYNHLAEIYNAGIARLGSVSINIFGLPSRIEADPKHYFLQLYEAGSRAGPLLDVSDVTLDLRSVYILTAAAVAIACYRRRHLLSNVIIILAAPVLAIICDTGYVTMTGLLAASKPAVAFQSMYGSFIFILPAFIILLIIARLTNRFRASTPFNSK